MVVPGIYTDNGAGTCGPCCSTSAGGAGSMGLRPAQAVRHSPELQVLHSDCRERRTDRPSRPPSCGMHSMTGKSHGACPATPPVRPSLQPREPQPAETSSHRDLEVLQTLCVACEWANRAPKVGTAVRRELDTATTATGSSPVMPRSSSDTKPMSMGAGTTPTEPL